MDLYEYEVGGHGRRRVQERDLVIPSGLNVALGPDYIASGVWKLSVLSPIEAARFVFAFLESVLARVHLLCNVFHHYIRSMPLALLRYSMKTT